MGYAMPADVNRRVGVRLGPHPLFLQLVDLFCDDGRRCRFPSGDASEVGASQLQHGLGLEVSDEHRGEVVGGVVGGEESIGLAPVDRLDVGRPADDRVVVRNRSPEHGVELFLELGGRIGFDAHSTLLPDDVALGVELAKDRVEKAVRLHPEPQLELVGRHVGKVEREVVRGARVQTRAPLGGIDLLVLVLDDQLAVSFLQRLHFADKLGEPIRSVLRLVDAAADLAAQLRLAQRFVLGLHLLSDAVEPRHDLGLPLRIAGADGRRSLEQHVFEQVRDARDAGPLVGTPDARHPPAGHRGVVVTVQKQ